MKQAVSKLLAQHLSLSTEALEALLETPKGVQHGDIAFPCFTLAKTWKKAPAQIAHELAAQLSSSLKAAKEFEKIEAAGPYVNFFIDKQLLAQQTLQAVLKQREKYGSTKLQRKVVIEFPSPNTNKPLHLGHARNIIMGQAVTNILRFTGARVIVTNLNNDRGIHICKSMLAYEKFGKSDTPQKAKRKPDHFVGDYYVRFAQAAKEHPALEQEAQTCLQRWEAGDKQTRALWKKMNSWALKGFEKTYTLFGLTIDKDYYESDIYDKGRDIVLAGFRKGIVTKNSDGALIIDLSAQELGEKVLLRADGTSIYITQDIYLALLKHKEFAFDVSMYIAASEQNYHFKALFATLEKLGYPWAKKLYHLNYGMVHLESGRMKSREGNVIDSDNLIEEMKTLARGEIEHRYPALSKKEKEQRTHAITMAALRYYFLKVDRTKDITFKPEESLSFEGDTGPYLLYSYARARSILRKAHYNLKKKYTIGAISDTEKALITHVTHFPDIVQKAYASFAPALIATYAFQLAQTFNEFYHHEKVIGSQEEAFRLRLVDAFSQVLKNALALLNITVLEKM